MLTREILDGRGGADPASVDRLPGASSPSNDGPGGPPPLPRPTTDAFELFSQALTAVSRCGDVVQTAASTTARSYVWGAAGALRNAMGFLSREDMLAEAKPGEAFSTKRVGSSELLGSKLGWDTALRCRLPDGNEGRVASLWPVEDAERGVWLRPDADLPDLWRRGSIQLTEGCIVFHDDAERDLGPLPAVGPDLGRDLISAGVASLHSRPAFAAALEITLTSGSWCHMDSGGRWFADPQDSRSIVRAMGGSISVDGATARRLSGIVDREALLLIERLGWRHVPTPGV